MNTTIVMELVNNAALLMALIIVYEISYMIPIKWKKIVPIFDGFLIGLIGIAIMTIPFQYDMGIYFDTRSILIGITALTFGLISVATAASILIIYRVILGGAGLWMGVAIIITSACIGIIWRHFLLPRNIKYRWINIYLFGIVVHIVMLADAFTLPWETSLQILRDISIPVMLIFPISTVLLSLVLLHQKERNESLIKRVATDQALLESENRLRLLVESAPEAIFIETEGKFSYINKFAISLFGAESEEQLINTPVLNRFHPDYHSVIKGRISILTQRKEAVPTNEEIFLKIDGTPVHVEVNAVPIHYNNID
ncbi:MAG TPA: LytS/YhcK type 5TM receptor domain-containing protein, partial [Anaerovoracaceae bacterium]|nr:LytS/YhcK type 5TM receptor domain-containing protein [Anaerovoracaceae bacterium]